MIYVIPGNPTPLLRARHSTKTNTIYNSQANQQLVSRIHLQEQHKDNPVFVGPIHVDITFFMPIAKTTPKKKVQPRCLALL